MSRIALNNLVAAFCRSAIAFLPLLMSRFIFSNQSNPDSLIKYYLYLAEFSIISLASTLGLGSFYIGRSLAIKDSENAGPALRGFESYATYGLLLALATGLFLLVLNRGASLERIVYLLITIPFSSYIGYSSMRSLAEFSPISQARVAFYQASFLICIGIFVAIGTGPLSVALIVLATYLFSYWLSIDVRLYISMLLESIKRTSGILLAIIHPSEKAKEIWVANIVSAATMPGSPKTVHLVQGIIGSISQPLYVYIITLSLSSISKDAESIFQCSRFTDAFLGIYLVYLSNRLGQKGAKIYSARWRTRQLKHNRISVALIHPVRFFIRNNIAELPIIWLASSISIYIFIGAYYGGLNPLIATYDFFVSSIKFVLLAIGILFVLEAPIVAMARDICFLLISILIFFLSKKFGLEVILASSILGLCLTLLLCSLLVVASKARVDGPFKAKIG